MRRGSALFVQYHSDTVLKGTDRVYAQDYASQRVVENGKIKFLREYLNIIFTVSILLPN